MDILREKNVRTTIDSKTHYIVVNGEVVRIYNSEVQNVLKQS